MLVGAVLVMRHWCYADWKRHLDSPELADYYALALEVFRQYPRSGARQTLQRGLDWRQRSREID